MSTPADYWPQVRAVLEEKGWAKGLARKPKACLSDAMHYARGGSWNHHAVDLYWAIRQLYPKRVVHGIVGFNDHPDTTYEDVLAVITLAAEREAQ